MQTTLVPITKIGDDYAIVFPPALRDKYCLDQMDQVEVTSLEDGMYFAPARDPERKERVEQAKNEILEQYADVFRRLAE